MKRVMNTLGAAWIGAALLAIPAWSPAWSQGAPQTVGLVKVDPQTVATGYRATKLIGASVSNDAGDTIGKVDDLIVSPDGTTPFAVLSVGGFLGLGERLVVVPYASLTFADNKLVLPGASTG